MEFNCGEDADKGGVYRIINKLNNRAYYGSSKSFKGRWYGHLHALLTGKHHNRFLQADFNKCGAAAFIFEVVEIVEGDKLCRTTVEQKYLNEYFDSGKLCYNLVKETICPQGPMSACSEETKRKIGAANKGRVISEEARAKMSEAHRNLSPEARERIQEGHRNMSPETRQKLVELGKIMFLKNLKKVQARLTGIPLTEEHKQKLSEAHKGHKPSEETKQKMSESHKGRFAISDATRKKMCAAQKGHLVSSEARLKMSNSKRGISTDAIKLVNVLKQKTYYFLSPAGIPTMIKNLKEFCKINGYSDGTMASVGNGTGRAKSYKGWRKANEEYYREYVRIN